MSQALKFLQGVGVESKLYSDDVFASYVRTGTGAEQTVTTNIDMTKGYMVWSKGRSGATDHAIYDSERGVTYDLVSNSTAAQTTQAQGLKSVSATGHTWGTLAKVNTSSATYVDWVFAQAPKFFDVVTFTAGTNSNRRISHELGVEPGLVVVKRTDSTGNWNAYHRSEGRSKIGYLNLSNAFASLSNAWGTSDPTSADFGIDESNILISGGTYIAYIFAHDTDADGIIQCGSCTVPGGAGVVAVNLGWEPQYVLFKQSGTSDWLVMDSARGLAGSQELSSKTLALNNSTTEGSGQWGQITATGFSTYAWSAGEAIYLAIRRPNKPPTSGTQVYNAIARTGTGAAATVTGVGFAPDLAIVQRKSAGFGGVAAARLQGADRQMYPSATNAEAGPSSMVTKFDIMDGIGLGTSAYVNANTAAYINWLFKRAPGVFDVVCYTGTGSATTVAHGLGVAPELMIVKCRSNANDWAVYYGDNTDYLLLNSTAATVDDSTYWNDTSPTTSVFSIGTNTAVNTSAYAYVAYLFATKAGISKCGSFTGNGSNQTINCGFTTGARFILIKRTDSTGDWYVWDSTRGIVAGDDPHLSLNTTTAEVTTDDSIDPDNSGFIVNQLAATNINVTSATYIFLAFA